MKNDEIIKRLSLTEKARLMSGATIWRSVAIPEQRIPSLFLSDGPTGLRKQQGSGDHLGLNKSVPATCYPTAATVANSWDVDLAEELGQYLGDEALEQKVDVLLGPGLNIKRSPLCGRNFEYFSEDPYLSGKMAAAYIKGIQKNGVGACPKHFAVNNQELHRMANNSIVDERALREVYLTGFELAVKEAAPKMMMTAYNKVNGIYANESAYLLREILHDEWGFRGGVVSDWGGSNDHIAGVKNGSHLEMPATGNTGALELVQAVQTGELAEAVLDERVAEWITTACDIRTNQENEQVKYNEKARQLFAEKVAVESIVLLKNEESILPLTGEKQVAIIGDFAKNPRYQGAGSSLVNPTKIDNVIDSLTEATCNITGYAQGYERGNKVNNELINQAKKLAEKSDILLLFLGLTEISEVEGLDREHMRLPKNQEVLLHELAKENKKMVVILSGGSAIEMPWLNKATAVVHCYLGGQAGGKACSDILLGKKNPSGKLNESYPIVYSDSPAARYYPGKEYNSEYRESLFVGYRYYEKAQRKVLFPFGFGLSYTSFSFSNISIEESGVTLTVANIGDYEGAEVVQLYVGKNESEIFRAEKELKGFKKVFLKKNEKTEIKLPFDDYTFRVFDSQAKKWVTERGNYQIYVGTSSQAIFFETEQQRKGVNLAGRVDKKKIEKYYTGEVTDLSRAEFEEIYGAKIEGGAWNQKAELGLNDTLSQMFYAKSILARGIYRILTRVKDKSIEKSEPNLNILFNYNMPFRAITKMTGGNISRKMTEGILQIVNGHFIKGTSLFLKGGFENRKVKKATDLTVFERNKKRG